MSSTNWSEATLVDHRHLSDGLHHLTLDVDPAIAAAFHSAGQYHRVRMRQGDDEAFFAIASAPGASRFEYLVKASPGVAGEWTALNEGAQLEVGVPEGAGFPVVASTGRDLVLVGTGTGFSPLWSVVSVVRSRRANFGSVVALWGVDLEAHLAWAAEFDVLRGLGIDVQPVLFKPATSWKGRSGRVQQHLPKTGPGTHAFLCGHPAMIDDVTEALERQGTPRGQVFLNT